MSTLDERNFSDEEWDKIAEGMWKLEGYKRQIHNWGLPVILGVGIGGWIGLRHWGWGIVSFIVGLVLYYWFYLLFMRFQTQRLFPQYTKWERYKLLVTFHELKKTANEPEF